MATSKQCLRSRLASGDINLATNWTQRSYQIALKLQERGEWPSYLATKELPWLKKALETPELWARFITPRTEQWRLHAPPAPIFDPVSTDPTGAPAAGNKAPDASATSPGVSTKRAAPQDEDGDVEMEEGLFNANGRAASRLQNAKRARGSTAGMTDDNGDENDDMLSVLSGSDIDMAMWTGDASLASNAVSPGSSGGTPGSGAQAAALQKDGHVPSADKRLVAAEKSIVCVMASFHARAAIFEQYVSVLCDTHGCTMCTGVASVSSAVELIEKELAGDRDDKTSGDEGAKASADVTEARQEDDDSMAAEVPSMAFVKPPTPLVSRSLEEDEDYDDDENEDDDGDDKDKIKQKEAAEERVSNTNDASGNVDGKPLIADTDNPATAGAKSTPIEPEAQPADDQTQQRSSEPSASDSSSRFMLRSVFHTMDELAEAVHEQEVHEIHVQQIKEVVEQRAAEPKDMLVNKIGSLQNMKNLAQFIDNHRDSVNMSTRELSHLLSEVRPKRTKWANDRRVGQVELYDALEHVLHELKAMGEVAMPFLNQVKRKDAPDYYKVIKHPMDLGAMAKNLRSEVYNNKKQFADHLQLIRDNCYTYNTEPGNYYRKSVDALLAKAKQLMENVPDITVREKGAAAAAAATISASGNSGAGDDAHTEFGDESGNESQSARTAYGNREGSVMQEDEAHASLDVLDQQSSLFAAAGLLRTPADAMSFAEGAAETAAGETRLVPQQQTELANVSSLAHSIMQATAAGSCTTGAIADIVEGYERPLGERIWSAKVRKQLAEYFRRIEQDASTELPDRSMPKRTADNMRGFLDSTHDTEDVIAVEEIAAIGRQNADIAGLRTVYSQTAGSADAAEARRRNEMLDGKREAWLESSADMGGRGWDFVSECEPAAGLPLLETLESQMAKSGVLRWLNDDCEATVDRVLGPGEPQTPGASASAFAAAAAVSEDVRPPIDAYAVARFPDNAMWRGMAGNVDKLRSIREIDSKIWAIKLSAPIGYANPIGGLAGSLGMPQGDMDEPNRLSVRETFGKFADKPDPAVPFDLDAASARKLLQRTSALILAHTGFDSITEPAMSTLADFFIDYMTNLGRTLRSYYDKHGRTMSTEAILAHTLYDNGTEDLVELEYYMRAETDRYSSKLSDLHRKLSKSYQEVVGEGRPESAVDASALETGDAFVTGMVGGLGDLGDDFFGFKELGLDKEFGMESLSVPQRLWYGRSAMQGVAGNRAVQQEELAHRPPEPWAPIVSPQGQIGLMTQFICKKLKEVNGVDPPGYEGVADGAETADKTQAAAGASKAKEKKPVDGDNEDEDEDGEEGQEAKQPDVWAPIPEDDSLPVRMRFGASRPKAPAPNYLTHPKTHMHVGSGQVATPSARTAKKRPAKTTAASKTTASAASSAAKGAKKKPAAEAATAS